MTRSSPTRKRRAEDAVSRIDVVQPDTPAPTSGGFASLLESATQEILAVTYWFDPDPHSESSSVMVRFSGHRVDVKGRLKAADRFVRDETIEHVVPGSGPISLTARVRDISAGKWAVTAEILKPTSSPRGKREERDAAPATAHLHPVARFWRKWAPPAGSVEAVNTCPTPFVHVPGILPGIWGALVTLGMIIALALQALVISVDHLALGPWWAISLVAIAVGIAGAKIWYIVLHWRTHRIDGWCIQGFIASAPVAAAIMLVTFKVPVGTFLDAIAPGLMLGLAVGRVGCFFAGCCGGPPTASRWGVWSSDQRVGARRIPTQLLESLLALSLGLGVLVAILVYGPKGGAFFIAALAAYTLVRQGILRLRAEPRRTKLGGPVTAIIAALVLIAAVVLLVR